MSINLKSKSIWGTSCFSLIFAALYWSSYSNMLKWWLREDYTYCFFVLPVTGYLLWEKRTELQRIPLAPTWTGLVPVILALVLYWLGELGGEFYTLYLSSWLMIVGLCWLHLGIRRLKIMAFPLCFLLAMFPLPNLIYNNVSLRLKLLSSRLGVKMLQVSGLPAYREGNVIDLGFTQLQVVDACSGLRYLIPLLVLGILLAYYFRAARWKKIVLVLSTVPLALITNSLRIASVGFLYQFWGARVAEGFFHDFSGWLIFMVSLGVLLGEMWLLGRIFRSREPATTPSTVKEEKCHNLSVQASPKALFWKSGVAGLLLLVTLVVGQTIDFREKVPLSKPLVQFPLTLGEWQGTSSGMEQKFLQALKLSDYLLADYKNPQSKLISLYVAYKSSQRKGESTHSPASCLPGSGWVFNESGVIGLTGGEGGSSSTTVNRAYMQKAGERMVVYYWFPQRGHILTSMVQLKLYAFWDAITRHRTDGGMVRLTTPIYEVEQPADAEVRLAAFARQVVPLLPDFIPN